MTLIPKSWSIRKAAKEFNVSKSTIQKAKLLRDTKGIIAEPENKMGKKLNQAVIDAIKSFYNDDEYTRPLPGKKDSVSIGNKQHMSKRLILCNLKELYTAFKAKYSELKLGFK